jgi:dihydropyrimidine dehydrogenase (NAD+) subunit PreA
LSTHGGYCGPAVKPIALNMVAECARDPQVRIAISGIGGIATWQDAVEFMLMGATTVQVCTAVMHHGFRIIEDMIDGLNNYLDGRRIGSASDLVGKSVQRMTTWENLNLRYKLIARIDQDKCIHCNKCWVACEDAAHQCIDRVEQPSGITKLIVDENECVGCNLCYMVCPVEECISMLEVDTGLPAQTWKQRQAAQTAS